MSPRWKTLFVTYFGVFATAAIFYGKLSSSTCHVRALPDKRKRPLSYYACNERGPYRSCIDKVVEE